MGAVKLVSGSCAATAARTRSWSREAIASTRDRCSSTFWPARKRRSGVTPSTWSSMRSSSEHRHRLSDDGRVGVDRQRQAAEPYDRRGSADEHAPARSGTRLHQAAHLQQPHGFVDRGQCDAVARSQRRLGAQPRAGGQPPVEDLPLKLRSQGLGARHPRGRRALPRRRHGLSRRPAASRGAAPPCRTAPGPRGAPGRPPRG